MARTKSMAATAAKELKKQLQTRFPGVTFRVGSKNYAGGSSLDVRWDFGPTVKQVEELAIQRQHGYFDGMSDGYRYTGAGMEVGDDGQMKEMASVKYVFCSRNTTEVPGTYAMREDVKEIYKQIASCFGWLPNSDGSDYYPGGIWNGANETASNMFFRAMQEMKFSSDKIELLEWKWADYEYNGRRYSTPWTIIYRDLVTGQVMDAKA